MWSKWQKAYCELRSFALLVLAGLLGPSGAQTCPIAAQLEQPRYSEGQRLALCNSALHQIKGNGPIYLEGQFTDRLVRVLQEKDSRVKGREKRDMDGVYDVIALWDPIRINPRRRIGTVSVTHEAPKGQVTHFELRLDMRRSGKGWTLRPADSHALPSDASYSLLKYVIEPRERRFSKEKVFVNASSEVKSRLRKIGLNIQSDAFKSEKDYQDTGFMSLEMEVIAWIDRTEVRMTVDRLYRPAGNDVSYSYGAQFTLEFRKGTWIVRQVGSWQGE